MIHAEHLVKWYGPTQALDDLTFEIPQGQIVGFLGPNGAGKSTAIRILTGYLPPTSGAARVAGHDVLTDSQSARAHIGYLPESNPLYPEMRVEEYLHYRGKLMGMSRADRRKRIDAVADRCGLAQIRRRLIGHLSKGNRQRVGIAQALLHEPPVLILDEPTSGLDPMQIGQVRQLIVELRDRHTVLLSSHILPEIEKTADHVMIIAQGRIVAQGTPEQLRRHVQSGARVLVEVRAADALVAKLIKALPHVARVQTTTHEGWCRATVTPRNGADVRAAVGQALFNHGHVVREMRFEAASLEEFFIQVTSPTDPAEPVSAA